MAEIIPASKSEMIRALIIKSWAPTLEVYGETLSEDVSNIQKALDAFSRGERSYYVGDSALGLRSWLTRLSREKGEFEISGTRRLFERPHQELYEALRHLGSEIHEGNGKVILKSFGWKPTSELKLTLKKSSQYLSSILLNSWNLDFPLHLEFEGSSDYLGLTIEMLRRAGMVLEKTGFGILIPTAQKVSVQKIDVEPDMSTAFTMAAWKGLSGGGKLSNFSPSSLQPDFKFVEILRQMGAEISTSNGLEIHKFSYLKPLKADISNSPDLFPVLVALCALAEGPSELKGAEQLKWKESDRLKKASEFLHLLGRSHQLFDDGIIIHGKPVDSLDQTIEKIFDPDHDHRWVMAAHAAALAGFKIKITSPEAIMKTAPELFNEVAL